MEKFTQNLILSVLMVVGLFSLFIAVGEPTEETSDAQWFASAITFASISGICFFAWYKLIKKWDK